MTSPTPQVPAPSKKNSVIIIFLILVILLMGALILILGISLFNCNTQPKNCYYDMITTSQTPTPTQDPYEADTPSDTILVSQKIGAVELEFVMVNEASGFPGILTLTIDGNKQEIGKNRCYTAELSDDAKFLVTQCEDNNEETPLVIWEYNQNAKTFIRQNETSQVGLVFPAVGSWYEHTFIATTPITEGAYDLTQKIFMIVMDGDNNSVNSYEIEAGEYGAAHEMASVPVISPDGQYVLVQAEGNEKLNVYDLEGTKVASYVTVFTMDYNSDDPNWSPLLDYRWSEDGSVIEYKYPLEEESAYRQIFFN